ncbi:MAG: helix-turn-helix transcriptional regulator [Pyrinomonadaceae bacterium]|nr:helix-turn-helix transcriptional regulator [Pyrinomonadaceae bacterium]
MKDRPDNLSSKIVKEDQIAGFLLTENTYPQEYRTEVHAHDYDYFCFVLNGDYTLKYREKAFLCQPSKLLFFPRGTDHACYMHTNSRCFNFRLNPQVLEFLSSGRSLPIDEAVQKSPEVNRLMSRLYQEFYTVDEFSPLTVEGLISEITAAYLRQTSNGRDRGSVPKWLLTASEYIKANFADAPTISEVAGISGVHPTHLAREFRRHFHITIGDFVRKKRVESACQKIIRSETPLSEIALETGFFDQSHFTRIFKKATGMTPAVYRETFTER